MKNDTFLSYSIEYESETHIWDVFVILFIDLDLDAMNELRKSKNEPPLTIDDLIAQGYDVITSQVNFHL